MKPAVQRARNKIYYRILHVPLWIWAFWILPGHLTADLYAHGPDRRHWIWLAIITIICAWRGFVGRLPGVEPRPYITHYGENKPNLWYRMARKGPPVIDHGDRSAEEANPHIRGRPR